MQAGAKAPGSTIETADSTHLYFRDFCERPPNCSGGTVRWNAQGIDDFAREVEEVT
jgi:hypothetical protein